MRTVDATLQAALPTAAGTFIAKVQIKRAALSETITIIKGFEINEGQLTAWVKIPTANKPTTVTPGVLNDTVFQISRGLNIQGTDYYFASSWFVLTNIKYTDKDIIYSGHIFVNNRYTTPGDVAVNTLVGNVLANSYVSGLAYSNTITYPSDVEWWKTIKFYPAGRTFVLQNIQRLNSTLQQKYILNLVDIGGNVLVPHDNGQINQYEPIDPVITPITTVFEFSYNRQELLTKYYIWRDEASTIHTSGSSTRPIHNLGYIESTVTPFALDEYDPTKVTFKLAPPDLRLTIQDYIRATALDGITFANDWFRIKETFDPDAKIPWYQTLESIKLLANTEGGAMPSTIEAAAPYTPLVTGNFNAVLSSNDNNLQAAMETLDDHAHTSAPTTFALTGDITPSQITADQNDYNPTGLSTASVLRLSSDAGRVITGIQGGADGRILVLINVGSWPIYLQNESTSTAAYRFSIGQDFTLVPGGGSAALIYDSTTSRWRALAWRPSPSDGNMQPVASAASPGTANTYTREDHIHQGTPIDGWNAATVTWTRTGNHTFTVSGDLTATYRKGTKVRYKDGGSNEYGVILSSSHAAGTTTVNLIVNTDYTMAAATITEAYISFIENPEGFPQWFNWSTTWTNYTIGNGTQTLKWRATGSQIFYKINTVLGSTSTVGTDVSFTPPAAHAEAGTRPPVGICTILDTGTALYFGGIQATATTTFNIKVYGTAGSYANNINITSLVPMTWTTSDEITIQGSYEY